ncbi:MAG: Lrp/AsnC family transcriptional regulator [Trueperaceae bacterium]|nr:Lrp/AsnC family transcriptional regulator [Trueperaceae bacterium]
MAKPDLDDVDRKILVHLREEGRASHAEIAERVRRSAPAVGERIKKLMQRGVIHGFHADVDPDAVGLSVAAFVALAPTPGSDVRDLVTRLKRLPEVQELHSVAGTYSYLAKVRTTSPTALDAFLDDLMMMDGVERTETTMVLRTNLERPAVLPFDPAPAATDAEDGT